jgi:hypothetical protein
VGTADDGVNRCEGVAQQGNLYGGCWRARQWRSLPSQIHTCVEMSRRFKHCLSLYQVRSNAALLMVLTAIILRSDQDSGLLAVDVVGVLTGLVRVAKVLLRWRWFGVVFGSCVVWNSASEMSLLLQPISGLRTPRNNLVRIPDTSTTTSHSVSTSNHARQPRFKSYYTLASSHQ